MTIVESSKGLFCEPGGFHVDPWEPVDRAVVTHAHGDHTRPGSAAYLCAAPCEPLSRRRLPDARIEALPYAEPITIGNVRVSLHPAGHILGSAQVRLEQSGEVWVISGRHYARLGGVRVPVAIESTAKVKFVGTSQLEVSYQYETVNNRRVRVTASRPAALARSAGRSGS